MDRHARIVRLFPWVSRAGIGSGQRSAIPGSCTCSASDRLTAPVQAWIAWNRHRYKWRALVVRVVNPGLLHLLSIHAGSHLVPA